MPLASAPLTLREKLAFGCGDFASVLYWQTFMRYLPFFYTDVFGLSAAALATMLLLSRIWDAIDDPVIGMVADRTETRWGKFRPYILFGCVPFAFAGVLAFTTPEMGATGKLIWAYVTYNVLMVMYTVVNIPYTALLGVLTRDTVERTRLSSIKFIFAFSAGTLVSATLLPLVKVLGGDSPQRGWQLAFCVYGAVAVLFFLVTGFFTRERVTPVRERNVSILGDLRLLITNRPWLLLLATTLTLILFYAIRSSVSTHYFKYYLYAGQPDRELTFLGYSFTLEALVSTFNTVGQATSILGVVLVGVLAHRVRRKPLFIGLFLVSVASTACYYILTPGNLSAIFLVEFASSISGAPLSVLLWAMYADTADFGEWKSGRRTTALVFSASSMSQKFGWALAAYLAFKMLSLGGFVANVTPTAEVQSVLVLLMSIIPAGLGLISIGIFLFYPLTEDRMATIHADLNARRLGSPSAVS
ncbi:MAG TPA: MFS transporter [Opitutaceae bacterium]|nr:MFS transporter [Opitutaceae bacterium]